MAGSITVSGMSAGELAGERIFGPLTMVGRAVIGETLIVPMVTGENVVSVPAESVAVMIIPPLNSEVGLRLKTNLNSSDAGLPLSEASNPFVYPFPGGGLTKLILTASGPTTGGVSLTFI